MDKKTVESLYTENCWQMCRLATSILADVEEARDAVNDVFTRLLATEIVVKEGEEQAYIARCVRNECLNRMKHKSVRERFERLYSESLVDDEPTDNSYNAEALLSFAEEKFTDRMKQVFRLRFVEGKKYGEIANELAISHGAVYKHIVHCIDLIKNNFR